MRDDRERLSDVLSRSIGSGATSRTTGRASTTGELLQSAVLHWIEIIGEAARGVGERFGPRILKCRGA